MELEGVCRLVVVVTAAACCSYCDNDNPHPPNEARAIRREWRRAISAQLPAGRQAGVVHVSFGRVVFTDCESCTRSISTNPGSLEAGEYGLARRMCFVARRSEVVAVAGLLWISWCIRVRRFFRVFFVFFLRTHPACCKYEATLPPLPIY